MKARYVPDEKTILKAMASAPTSESAFQSMMERMATRAKRPPPLHRTQAKK